MIPGSPRRRTLLKAGGTLLLSVISPLPASAAPILAVLSALMARIYCEIMIVLFKINEALQDIRRK